jgi:Rrf2 family protein
MLAGLPEGARAGATVIAERIGAPPNYLGKLLRGMVREGLVDSQKGPGGGFRLARGAGRIRLLDVLESIEQISRWNGCFLGRPDCSEDTPCAVHSRWKSLRDEYLEMLAQTTIADLVTRASDKD